MATPEGKVKKFIDKFFAENFPEAWRYNPPGGSFGRAGIPDKLFLYKGVMIAIEAKAEGGVVTKLQKRELLKLKEQGCISAIVVGEDLHKLNLIKKAIIEELDRRGNR